MTLAVPSSSPAPSPVRSASPPVRLGPSRRPGAPSWARIALRAGVVSPAELRRARVLRRREGGSLEAVLLRTGALRPELARLVRAACLDARATCPRCGRRADDAPLHACRCPA